MLIRKRGFVGGALLVAGALLLSGCTSNSPLGNTSSSTDSSGAASASDTITVGSAAFPESEIVAEVYAQALDRKGITVKLSLNIGQREVYIKALQDGSIDLIPDYSGNLLQYYNKTATASSSAAVYAQLKKEVPKGFEVLTQSQAQDKDSYNVTKAFSEKYHLTSLAELKNVPGSLKLASNPESAIRPAGTPGLKRVYGTNVTLVPISDSGGPLTVKALIDGNVQLADIFTTSPAIKANHLVTLKDPENLILAQNVVPLINTSKASPKVTKVLNEVSKKLTTADLVEFNTESGGSAKEAPAAIAKQWLDSTGM